MATATTTMAQRTLAASTTTAATAPTSSATASTPSPGARPYKDFLTPALHRRFTHSAGVVAFFCWLVSCYISIGSGAGLFWSWFPLFSMNGLRTLLLLAPCLAVFIVRVMNMHVGKRTTTSPFETLVLLLTARLGKTLATVGWYVFSAWIFGETYIWSKGTRGNLAWIDVGMEHERAKVNENPFFLRSVLIMLAIWQATLHLAMDEDRLPVEEMENITMEEAKDQTAPLKKLAARLPVMLTSALQTSVVGFVFAAVIYFLTIRWAFWPYAFNTANALHRNLLQDKRPPGLLSFTALAWQSVSSLLMLIMLWKISNTAFTIYVTLPPLKHGEPFTSEVKDSSGKLVSRSKDPNGSLIRGLVAKREVPKTFAFWELYLICTTSEFPVRRKTIFTQVDRTPSGTWSQVSTHCLAEITGISNRIKTSQEPTEYQKKTAQTEQQRKQQEGLMAQQQAQSYNLPNIANRQVINDADVLLRNPPKRDAVHTFGNVAKEIGQHPAASNMLTPSAKRAIAWTEERAGGREVWSQQGLEKVRKGWMVDVLKFWPLGVPFQQTFARRAEAVVFGVPHSAKINIIHAVRALAALATASLREDDYGQVAKDVPAIIRALTTTLKDIDAFIGSVPESWTDVNFNSKHRDMVFEVKELQRVMMASLEEVVLAFAEYAPGLGLTMKELREAREAIGRKEEMREV